MFYGERFLNSNPEFAGFQLLKNGIIQTQGWAKLHR